MRNHRTIAATLLRWGRLACLLGGGLLAGGQIAAATLTAALDRATVVVGDAATLTLTFSGGNPEGVPQLPQLKDLRVQYLGESSQVSIVNGRMTSSRSYNYAVTPTQPGDYTIPPLQAVVGGTRVVSQALVLKAVRADAKTAPPNATARLAFLRLIVPKKEIFLGEVLPVEVRLYYQNAEQVQMPQLQAEGFTLGQPPQPAQVREQLGRDVYNVVVMQVAATAAKTGTLTLGPAECSLTLRIRQGGRRGLDPFDPFGSDPFDSFFGNYERRAVTVSSEPVEIRVLPLPSAGVPPSFTGAVGEFSLAVQASPTNLIAGDPITLAVQFSGRGNLANLNVPAADWAGFKTYAPSFKLTPTDALGLEGTKSFEQVIVPETANVRQVPPLEFSFFDPANKVYRTLQHAPIPIQVRPGAAAAQPTIMAAAPAGRSPDRPRDMVHIKPDAGHLALMAPPWVRQPWFLGLQALPLALVVGVWAWRRRLETLSRNPRLVRQRAVARLVDQGLRTLRQQADQQDHLAFFATTFRLLQEQLGERLGTPASSITEAVLEERVRLMAIEPTALQQLQELFHACNQARYAPTSTRQELHALIPKLDAALQSVRRLPDPDPTPAPRPISSA
jgi:hypothetical protein